MLPSSLKNLITQLSKLPEIGPRAATRLSLFLLNQPEDYLKNLAKAIEELKSKTKICQNCFNLTSNTLCSICADPKRDKNTICVVEDILDIIPIEQTKQYTGLYHVLGGLISPTEGLTPEKLKIKELVARIKKHSGQIASPPLGGAGGDFPVEIILAFNPTVEGDTTALYLERLLKPLNIKITRLARGLSTGGDLEYTDETTLINALKNRK